MRQQQFATLFAFICLFSASAVAQQPLPADRDLIRDRQERLLEEQRKRIEELQQLPGREASAEHAQPAQDERCFEIKSIKLQGVMEKQQGRPVTFGTSLLKQKMITFSKFHWPITTMNVWGWWSYLRTGMP